LSPGQRGAVETASVVLFVGDIDYQPQVEQAVESASGEVVSLVEVAGPDRLLEAGEHDDHADEEGDDHSDEEGAIDAHLWFDPEIMGDVAVRTGDAFAAADPDNADAYRENAEAVRAELAELGDDLEEMLGGDCRHDEAIVSHEAYGYLLEPFGYAQHGVTGINPEAGASSAELGELVDEIEEEGFEYVLTEPVEGREGAETVAREAGIELLEVSPLDAVGDDETEQGFPALVREQAEQFRAALSCS
jgi:zinc transport system substrate-binding protein